MQILIRAQGIQLTEAIEQHISNRTHFILSRFSGVIRKIEVFIADENGPKGGVDKTCVVKIKTDERAELVVKDLEDDLYVAVARALARAKQSLSRRIQRGRVFKRKRVTTRLEGEPTEADQPLSQP